MIEDTKTPQGGEITLPETPTGPTVEFETPKGVKPCSWSECRNGHQWRPSFALVDCGGCGSPTLMGKMENCPFCNEPTLRVSLRHDHIPTGAGVAQRCKGQKPMGEGLDIILERVHWRETEGVKEN